MTWTKRSTAIFVLATLMLMTAFMAGFTTRSIYTQQQLERFPLLAKRIQQGSTGDYHINFSALRQEIQSYIDSFGEDAEHVSVYFEYLSTGVSISVNEDSETVGASLMKVPVAMMLYRRASEGRVDLGKRVALEQRWLNDEYGTLYQKGVGYELSIREAARIMLVESDNTALYMLIDQMGGDFMQDADSVANFLDTSFRLADDGLILIGAQSYSSILKCLYLACFNSQRDSQEILQYLSESSFNKRLTLYTPDDLTVAHKIGTFSDYHQSDCGIFYVPERRYLLCVMVRGDDPGASRIIADISQKAYLFVRDKIDSSLYHTWD